MTEIPGTTNEHRVGAVTATRLGDRVVVVDRSCGHCPTCTSGFLLWCTDHGSEHEIMVPVTVMDPRSVLRSLTACAAFVIAGVDPSAVVLVLDEESSDPMAVTVLLRSIHPGLVLATSDPADTATRRAISQASVHGRADVVVARHLARAAVKAVVRGGIVCLSADTVEGLTVTELVQREVVLVGARSIQDLLERVA
jgi:threonine dehydrogenase-like Zn-dependent dehydrogenase